MVRGLKVVAVGNAFDGINLYGPFFGHEATSDFTDTLGRLNPYEVVTLEAPYKDHTNADEAVGLFTAALPEIETLDGAPEFLVTLWPDGTVEIATRLNPQHSWGPPVPMENRETR